MTSKEVGPALEGRGATEPRPQPQPELPLDGTEYDELVLWRDVISATECWRRIQLARAVLAHHGHTAKAAELAEQALCGEAVPKPRGGAR